MATGIDGSIFLAGTFSADFSAGSQTLETRGEADVFFLRTDTNGNVQWAKRAGSQQRDEVTATATDSENNLIGIGSFWFDADFDDVQLTATQNPKAIFMTKYAPDGQVRWAKAINGSNLKRVEALAIDATDHIFIAGYFSGSLTIEDTTLTATGETDLFVARFSAVGNLLWAFRQGRSGDTRALALALTSEGDIILTGFFNDTTLIANERLIANTDDRDLFLARISAEGQPTWARKAGGVFDKDPVAVAVDAADNIYITGFLVGVMTLDENLSIQSQTGRPDFFLVKYSATGMPLAARSFGGNLLQQPTGMLVQGNSIVVSGFYQGQMSFDGFSFDAGTGVHSFVLGFSADNMQVRWAKNMAADNAIFATNIAGDTNAHIWVSGSLLGQATFDNHTISADSYDIFLAGLQQEATSTFAPASGAKRFLVFPNPAREFVLVQTELTNYTVQLYDSTGREVIRATNAKAIDVRNLPGGIYVLYLMYDGQAEVQRIVVSRKD